MKVKYIKEGYFKTPNEIVAANKNKSKVERIVAVARKQIQPLASKRFDTEFKEYLIGVNGIFDKSFNDVTCEKIQYYFIGDILHCEFTLGIGRCGYGLNSGDVEISLNYPENIREIENSIKEEYNCNAKVIINLTQTNDYAYPIFKIEDDLYYALGKRKLIKLQYSDCEDLTDFCHLLNCIKGIDFTNGDFALAIKKTYGYPQEINSNEELIHKFQTVVLSRYDLCNVTGLDKILSNEVSDELHRAKPFYHGVSVKVQDLPKYTGILVMNIEPGWQSLNINDINDIVNDCNDWANTKITTFDNLFLKLRIDGYYKEGKNQLASDIKDSREDGNLNDTATNLSLNLTFQNDYTGVYLFNEHRFNSKDWEDL